MKKIIFDCDNTFGVKDCDVDDGLALMYLLGSREAQLLGITSTYGNSSLDVVQAVNLRMLEELGRRDIPVKRGGEKRGCYQSEAALFLGGNGGPPSGGAVDSCHGFSDKPERRI